jgi:hypothetical protein
VWNDTTSIRLDRRHQLGDPHNPAAAGAFSRNSEKQADTGTICAARTSPMPAGMDLLRAAAASERVS